MALVAQELSLAPHLSVLDNIWLGSGAVPFFHRRAELREKAARALEMLGVEIDLDVPVGQLTLGQRQVVEIARLIARDARVLILDEPTATLSDVEIERTFAVLRCIAFPGALGPLHHASPRRSIRDLRHRHGAPQWRARRDAPHRGNQPARSDRAHARAIVRRDVSGAEGSGSASGEAWWSRTCRCPASSIRSRWSAAAGQDRMRRRTGRLRRDRGDTCSRRPGARGDRLGHARRSRAAARLGCGVRRPRRRLHLRGSRRRRLVPSKRVGESRRHTGGRSTRCFGVVSWPKIRRVAAALGRKRAGGSPAPVRPTPSTSAAAISRSCCLPAPPSAGRPEFF